MYICCIGDIHGNIDAMYKNAASLQQKHYTQNCGYLGITIKVFGKKGMVQK